MRKFYILLKLIMLAHFFTINLVCCGEDYFLDTPFEQTMQEVEYQNIPDIPSLPQYEQFLPNQQLNQIQNQIGALESAEYPAIVQPQEPVEQKKVTEVKQEISNKQEKKEKKTLFSFLKRKNKDKEEQEQKGYYGTLPKIYPDFAYKKEIRISPKRDEFRIPSLSEIDEFNNENLQEAPVSNKIYQDNVIAKRSRETYDNMLFSENLVKKQKTNDYVNDIVKLRYSFTNLKNCIEQNQDIQRFNACVNMLDLQSENLKTKYENKSESLKESYKDIIVTTYYSKVLGNLLYDANYYSKYVPTSEGKYSKDDIEKEKKDLLQKIDKTIFIINQEL